VGKILTILGIVLQVYSAQAVELYYFSYSSIVNPVKFDQRTPGIYGTKIRLFKIQHRPNTVVSIPEGPDMVEVSLTDLNTTLTRYNAITHVDESILSPADGRIGSLEKVTLEDGQVITPGLYYLKSPESYEYLMESPEGRSYPLEDFKSAEQLETQRLGTMKGPFWKPFMHLLSNQESAGRVGLIMSRGQDPYREWSELGDYWIEKGYAKYKMNPKNIYNLALPQFHEFGMEVNDFIGRRVKLMKEIVTRVAMKRQPDASDMRLNPNGNGEGLFHTFHFVIRDQKTLFLAIAELKKLASSKFPVKIIIHNAGDDVDVQRSFLPRHMVLTREGSYREATPEESFGNLKDQEPIKKENRTEASRNAVSCMELFK
jgi:hypothetical protein